MLRIDRTSRNTEKTLRYDAMLILMHLYYRMVEKLKETLGRLQRGSLENVPQRGCVSQRRAGSARKTPQITSQMGFLSSSPTTVCLATLKPRDRNVILVRP